MSANPAGRAGWSGARTAGMHGDFRKGCTWSQQNLYFIFVSPKLSVSFDSPEDVLLPSCTCVVLALRSNCVWCSNTNVFAHSRRAFAPNPEFVTLLSHQTTQHHPAKASQILPHPPAPLAVHCGLPFFQHLIVCRREGVGLILITHSSTLTSPLLSGCWSLVTKPSTSY